jgi:hypothetical protein
LSEPTNPNGRRLQRSEASTNSHIFCLRFWSVPSPLSATTPAGLPQISRPAHAVVRRHLPVGPSQLWRPPSFPALPPLVAALSLVLPLAWCGSGPPPAVDFSVQPGAVAPPPRHPPRHLSCHGLGPSPPRSLGLSWPSLQLGLALPFLRGPLSRSLVAPGRHRAVPGGTGCTSSLIGPWLGLSR